MIFDSFVDKGDNKKKKQNKMCPLSVSRLGIP